MDVGVKRFLFLGAHLDDIEFGCGGLLSRLTRNGYRDLMYLTLSRYNKDANNEITIKRDLKEIYKAISELGLERDQVVIKDVPGQIFEKHSQRIREMLLEVRAQFDPDFVFFPSEQDIHQDHAVLSREAERIYRNRCCLGYELIRSTYHFRPNLYISLNEIDMIAKINSLEQYESQRVESAGYYFDADIIRSTLRFRGGQCNREFAEAYELYHCTL
jgi:N-acetylglucosamine malate deacetylase 1